MNPTTGRHSASAKHTLPSRPHSNVSASAVPRSSSRPAGPAGISTKPSPTARPTRPQGGRPGDKPHPRALPSSNGRSNGQSEEMNFVEIHDLLVSVAKEAGTLITRAKTAAEGIETKKSSVDLVTQTDQEVEALVSRTLRARYPSFAFIGEETNQSGRQLTDEPTFICDPIDGTTNFVHQVPLVAISLGFTYKKEPFVGVVYNPFTGQLYTGIKSQGSYVTDLKNGGKKVKLPLKQPLEPLTTLSEQVVIIEWGSERDGPEYDCKCKTFGNLTRSKQKGGAMVHGCRTFGCASLNLCSVASGSIDLYWEGGVWVWDICAGLVILNEAGGMVVDGNPGRWEIPTEHRVILAVRPSPRGAGQQEVVKEFWTHVAGRLDYRP